jgi:hypothetical protein
MAQLVPCPECLRHVRASDAGCPFCGHADLPAAPRYEPGLLKGLGRAAIFALGATLSAGAAGCDSEPTPMDAGIDAAMPEDSGPASFDAAYGAPPFDSGFEEDAGADAGTDAGQDAGPVAAYGGPPVDGGP